KLRMTQRVYTIIPSFIKMCFLANLSTSAEWVIIRIVFHSSFSFVIISITSFPVLLSRAPVGSSHKIRRGSVTIALAIATRCCCQPDISFGRE
ncbi:TPA: hypothetical protein DEG21_05515, partial [Patescibacteria group bacterium]|nr:hypothetical protein [Candidatus Gracilibacteria bacterium]